MKKSRNCIDFIVCSVQICLYTFYKTTTTKQTNKQTKIKFTHLVDDLQNCLDLQRKKNKVNNYFKINDYKMPCQKSTLCALFLDQMTTRKQNKNKENNKKTTTTTPTDKNRYDNP